MTASANIPYLPYNLAISCFHAVQVPPSPLIPVRSGLIMRQSQEKGRSREGSVSHCPKHAAVPLCMSDRFKPSLPHLSCRQHFQSCYAIHATAPHVMELRFLSSWRWEDRICITAVQLSHDALPYLSLSLLSCLSLFQNLQFYFLCASDSYLM